MLTVFMQDISVMAILVVLSLLGRYVLMGVFLSITGLALRGGVEPILSAR